MSPIAGIVTAMIEAADLAEVDAMAVAAMAVVDNSDCQLSPASPQAKILGDALAISR